MLMPSGVEWSVFLYGFIYTGLTMFIAANFFYLSFIIAEKVGYVMIANSFNIVVSFLFNIYYYG